MILLNTAIGIVQEVRAKRVLDRLSLRSPAPGPRVAGRRSPSWRWRVVMGDALHLDQATRSSPTGASSRPAPSHRRVHPDRESDQVAKEVGDEVLSGAYCAAGSGDFEVERVGADSFAERIASEARGTRTILNPLQQDINRVLKVTVGAMVPLAIALAISSPSRTWGRGRRSRRPRRPLVPLVPEVDALTSLTFAVAAVRLGRLGMLAQRLNATESLASVDTMCFDKTGTLTDNRIRLDAVEPAQVGARRRSGRCSARWPPARARATARCRRSPRGCRPRPSRSPPRCRSPRCASGARSSSTAEAPSCSARRTCWSAPACRYRTRCATRSPAAPASGAGSSCSPGPRRPSAVRALPAGLEAGIALLVEGLREDSIGAVAFLASQKVDLKVISGDGVETVQAVALAAGVPGAERALAGPDIPEDDAGLAAAAPGDHGLRPGHARAEAAPHRRADGPRALRRHGRRRCQRRARAEGGPARHGHGQQPDGQGRSDFGTLSNRFSTVPAAIEQGRRIIRNTHRVAKLFVTKSVYAAVLLATFGLAPVAYAFPGT